MTEDSIELADFVRSTLVAVATGVRGANGALKVEGVDTTDWFSIGGVAGKSSGVSFDIALAATRGQRDKIGFMVALAPLGGGAKTEKDRAAESAHRIRFDVTVRYERV